MVRQLQLYPKLPRLAIETEQPKEYDSDCTLCPFASGVKTVCMRPEKSHEDLTGSLLLISDFPSNEEDIHARQMISKAGNVVRWLLKRYWTGPVVVDNALKCKVGKRPVRDTHIKACRGYLANTFAVAKPKRVVVLGSHAIYSVLGRSVPPLSARRGYTWMIGPPLTPVFILFNPTFGTHNRFVHKWFEEDFKWATTCDVEQLKHAAYETWDGVVNVIESEQDGAQAISWAKKQRFISYDFETSGKMFEKGTGDEPPFRNLCVSIGSADDPDVWTWDKRALNDATLRQSLKTILKDSSIKKVGQNEKYDRHCAEHLGIVPEGYTMDVRLMRKLHDPEATVTLKVIQELVGMGGGKEEINQEIVRITKRCRQKPIKKNPERGSYEDLCAEFGERKMPLVMAVRKGDATPEKYAFGLVREDVLLRYNAIDARSTALIADQRAVEMQEGPIALKHCWERLMRPLSIAIGHVERWGIHTDLDAIEMFQSTVAMRQEEAMSRIRTYTTMAGMPEFDPAKTDHVRDLLYNKLRLKSSEKTPTGLASTDKAALHALSSQHPVVDAILDWRSVDKNKGTYADPLSMHVRSDGRVHPSIKLDGARSGRMSCTEPNLFNIPRPETPEGKMARDCFAAPDDDHELLQFDFSQLELRVAAMESDDPLMKQIFIDGDDYHKRTALMVSEMAWNIKPENLVLESNKDLLKKCRSEAKTINFGILYGMGAWTLAAKIGCEPEQAERTMMAIMGRFKKLKRYAQQQLMDARRTGYVWTTWANELFRRRPMWRIADRDDASKSRAERGTLNTPIQGKAADFCLWSLIECVNWILEERIEKKVKLVLTVYDSIMFEVHKSMSEEVLYTVPKIMLQWPANGVPLVVDAERGMSWGSLEKVGSFTSIK